MSNYAQNGIALVNEELSLLTEAKISLTDRGFLFGHAVFETLLVKHGRIINWAMHFERLTNSCKKSLISTPEHDFLEKLAKRAVEENIQQHKSISPKASLRIIVTGGNSLDLPISKENGTLPKPNTIIICRNIAGPSKENYANGISLKSTFDVRPKELVDIKSCNYLFNIMALEEAHEHKYSDALFYDKNGIYTESTTANFIWFDENLRVYSAPIENNCLAGTTLLLLVEALAKSDIEFQWKALQRKNLPNILGAAILSSTRLILPVSRIDDIELPIEKYQDFLNKLNLLLEKKLSL